jgi:hypothetical protein
MSRLVQRRIATLLVGLVIAGGWLFTGMMLMRAHVISDAAVTAVDRMEPSAAAPPGMAPDDHAGR